MNEPKSPESRIATIKLDEATRKRILAELGVQASADWIPDTIHVARVHSTALGARPTRPNPWLLVMV